MKKIIVFMLCCCIVFSVVPTMVSFADSAWEIANKADHAYESAFLDDGREYTLYSGTLYTDYIIDETIFDGINPIDIYGIPVLAVAYRSLLVTPEELLNRGDYIPYMFILDESMNILEAIEITKDNNHIKVKYEYVEYPSDPIYITGDVNGNGKIDARDYLLLKRAYFGTYNLTCDTEVADINGNGKLDARDYLLLKRAYFGTYTIGTPDATPDEA